MYILFIALILQGKPQAPRITVPTAPRTVSTQSPNPHQMPPIDLTNSANKTVPTLGPTSEELIHIKMAQDISGQGEALGDLKGKVSSLEDKREKVDRPDIDSLKESRNHIEWTWGILATVFCTLGATVWYFKKIIWADILRPRLAREISQSEATSKAN